MANIAVIYKSIYGTTKQYAEWIAEELSASLLEASNVKPAQLMDYDVVIYGGGLYAGGIAGAKLVSKNPCKSLVVFTVGLATPEITDYTDIITKSFTSEYRNKIKVFHLQGGMDYGQLSMIHKAMMAFKKKEVEKTPLSERTNDDLLLLETYGGKCVFTDRETIKPLVDYVRAV
ncbi:MAG: flavodoxin domain-containing protein [Oscillospiraceae bacterium]|jgi:menaquinone-dependent protoporphyrinogen IX oxidase|nr:flavodoxin domain-containing protein [Oscillospiraceae bacterium]